MKSLENAGIFVGILIVLALVGGLIFRVTFVDFVDNYEFGYRYDALTGEITELKQTGYIVSMPFITKIHTIDTRPFQVNISANSRVLNAKLIQFNPAGYKLFISWHGRGDYDIHNGGSSNGVNSGGLEPILTSYAFDPDFDPKEYPFLRILKELRNDHTSKSNTASKTDATAVSK